MFPRVPLLYIASCNRIKADMLTSWPNVISISTVMFPLSFLKQRGMMKVIVSFSVEWGDGGGGICDHTSNYVKERGVVAHYFHDKGGKPMK